MAAKKKTDKPEKVLHTLKEAGRTLWAHIVEPDEYKETIKYKLDVVYDKDTPYTRGLKKRIDKMAAEQVVIEKAQADTPAKAKKIKLGDDNPYGMIEDDDGNETGEVYFRFSMNSSYKDRNGKTKSMRPALFDAAGVPIVGDVRNNLQVGNGSRVKVSMEVYPYCMNNGCGVSLRMRAVQIIDLVEFNSATDADEFGFGVEEGFDVEDLKSSGATSEAEGEGFGNEEEDDGETPEPEPKPKAAKAKRTRKAKAEPEPEKEVEDDDDDDFDF